MSEAQTNGNQTPKKASWWKILVAILGALATVITAAAGFVGSMDIGKKVEKNETENELMMKQMISYADHQVGELREEVAELKGRVAVLQQVCVDTDGDAIAESPAKPPVKDKPAGVGGGGVGGAVAGTVGMAPPPECATGEDCAEGEICLDGFCSDPDEPMEESDWMEPEFTPPEPGARRPRPAPPSSSDSVYYQMQQQVQEQMQRRD